MFEGWTFRIVHGRQFVSRDRIVEQADIVCDPAAREIRICDALADEEQLRAMAELGATLAARELRKR